MEVTDKFYRQKQPVWRTKVREDLITQENIPMKSSSSETQAQCSNSAVGLHVIKMWVQFPGKDEGQSSLITEQNDKVLTFGNHGTFIRLLPGQGTNPHWTSCCHELFSACSQSDALSFPPLWSNHLVFAYFYRWIIVNSSLLQISSKCRNPQVMRLCSRILEETCLCIMSLPCV